MDFNDSRGLLESMTRVPARGPSERPALLRSKFLNTWMRTLQYETDEFDEMDHEQATRVLKMLENLVQSESSQEQYTRLHHAMPNPKFEAFRHLIQHLNNDLFADSISPTCISKRKRGNDSTIEHLSPLEMEAKKRRVLSHDVLNMSNDLGEPKVDLASLTRKHLVSLHQALQAHWTCVCQKCSGLSVRLSLPRLKMDSQMETTFEVLFGMQSQSEVKFQESKITIKNVQNDKVLGTSELAPDVFPESAHICQCITESLDQQNCMHLLLEDGLFKKLCPQPKTYGDSQPPQLVSLSALFKRQQELSGGSSVLPLKGRRILALVLATALLPFLETPWIQPSFNHSMIQYFQKLQDGELPDITKPFLTMEQVPICPGDKTSTRYSQPKTASSEHMIHPNASVLALGILLCELHYCTSIESWQNDSDTARNVNTDYYTSLKLLKDLEVDASADYYLAAKACLEWESFPAGELMNFESDSVQRLFYQNVIKRLESEIFKSWRLRLEDLSSLDSRQNELCWGPVGRDVVCQQINKMKSESSARNNDKLTVYLPPASNMTPPSYILRDPAMSIQTPAQYTQSLQNHSHCAEYSSKKGLQFFDANSLTASKQDSELSAKWIDRLISSISRHVDSFDAAMQLSAKSIRNKSNAFKPVRIAIIDTGFDASHPFIRGQDNQLDARIKAAQNFAQGSNPRDIQDVVGHGTHALGLLLKVATCAEIYIAKVANKENAINCAVTEWKVDIISMSFGIREYHEPMRAAVSNAIHNQTLMFAAASNDGANFGRCFPAKYPGVFCMHSTDGNGNPSGFNPTAVETDVNFSLLGEHVSSHWPVGKGCHNQVDNVLSGTSVATPIAAALAASVLSFVRQQELGLPPGTNLLGPWLKDPHSMDAVLKSMVRQRRGAGYDYITPHTLLGLHSSRGEVYNKIKDIREHMYD
ncbi:hypothetical protein M441DRAFT_134148 [Trichoderma asperellum CBS 433.97]|uniref:Uncharacterized protein n=1 Tax=Trichoderma asperellum (strain ATCC 204424 / CBS 433.97 / NBRC 101777) TaxID=1042311 RepID=A0A2T3ZEP6_TRIA4|nr:hypothetical protein M441DRAFT_134148 [Trichoderma asperellum CBS 433.97]PTB43260.1 hypothetical protein M441DRAFT_134148 [Trichoderma asperellum CBS 433.97]